jgi:hypothetical protein
MGTYSYLPDFVYFNHAQHVTVGGIECQTCHGPVETYEKAICSVNDGWCINCHRVTNVKMEGMNITLKFMMSFLKIWC